MMDYSLFDINRVLILAPHPDDEVLGCGGTIALYNAKKVNTRLLVISDGEKISYEREEDVDIASIRRKEAKEAAEILGLKKVDFLSFPDGQFLSYKNTIELKIKEIVEEFRPDIIFSPSPFDFHQDHIITSEIALSIKTRFSNIKLAFYEVYNTIRFNTLINITKVMHIKRKAILAYKYSLFLCPEIFYDSIRGLNLFRSFYVRKRGFYEAFWVMSEDVDKRSVINWLSFGQWNSEDKEIDKLLVQIEEKEKKIAELEAYINNINSSFFWNIAKNYYKIRERLLPNNTTRRKLYDRVIRHLKG